MSCKSALYAANTNTQTLAVGDTLSFGTPVRRFGCNTNISGGNVTLNGAGYYSINTNINFTAAAGTATITLYKDGAAIPGATVNRTTVANTEFQVNIPAIVRLTCCCESTITAVVTGVATVIENAAITVEKL